MINQLTTTDLVLLIGVLTTSVVTIINAISTSRRAQLLGDKANQAAERVAKQAEVVADRVASVVQARSDTQDAKLDHITVLTNSTLSAALKRIDELERIIELMQHPSRGGQV